MIAYWARVVAEAFKRSMQFVFGSLGGFIVAAVSSYAIIWVLLTYGSPDAAEDELIVRLTLLYTSLFVAGGLLLWHLLKVPADWDKSKEQRIEELEDKLIPRIEFEFSEADIKHLESIREIVDLGDRPFTIGKVAIRNLSATETLEKAEVTLVNYRGAGDSSPNTVDRKLIAPSIRQQILDIHARRAENFRLFRVQEGVGSPSIQFGPFADGNYLTLPIGHYVVKTTASASATPHAVAFYQVSVNASGKVRFGPCPKDLDIEQAESLLHPAQ